MVWKVGSGYGLKKNNWLFAVTYFFVSYGGQFTPYYLYGMVLVEVEGNSTLLNEYKGKFELILLWRGLYASGYNLNVLRGFIC